MSKLALDNLSGLSKLDNVKSDNVRVANCPCNFNSDNLFGMSKLDNVNLENVWVANCLSYSNSDNMSKPHNIQVGL